MAHVTVEKINIYQYSQSALQTFYRLKKLLGHRIRILPDLLNERLFSELLLDLCEPNPSWLMFVTGTLIAWRSLYSRRSHKRKHFTN